MQHHSGKDRSGKKEPHTLASSLAHYVDDSALVPPSVSLFNAEAADHGHALFARGRQDAFVESCDSVLLEAVLFGTKRCKQILVDPEELLVSEKHALKTEVDHAHRAHIKEMLFVLSFLQRPRYVYKESCYDEVLSRFKTMRLEKELIDHLRRVYDSYAQYISAAPSVMLDVLLQLISMYAETMLLYAKALDEQGTQQEAASSHGSMTGGIESADLSFLYTFALEAGKEDRARAAQWGKSAVCVTVFLMHCAKSLLGGGNSKLLQQCCQDFGRSESPSIVSLVVPQCVLYCLDHSSQDSGTLNEFLQRASAAVATTRVFDMYTNAFFRRDSAEFSVTLNYTNDFLRHTLCRFFNFVPNDLLRTCHLNTFLSFCKAMAIYGAEWEMRPTALVALSAAAQNSMMMLENFKAEYSKRNEARLRFANGDALSENRDREALWMQTLGVDKASSDSAALPVGNTKNSSPAELMLGDSDSSKVAQATTNTTTAATSNGNPQASSIAKALSQQFQSETDYELYAYSAFNYVAAGDLRFLTSMESIAQYFTIEQREVAEKYDGANGDSSQNKNRYKTGNVLSQSIALLEGHLSSERMQMLFGTALDREDPQHESAIYQVAFVESTINLLLSLTFHCRTDLRGLSSLAGQDILVYCKHLCQVILPQVAVSAFIQDRVYNFVVFFSGGLGDLQGLADLLLKADVCALVGTDVHAVGTASAQMCVYAHLCSHSEAVSKERIFSALCNVPKGAIEQTLEGGTFFILASAHLHFLRNATFYAEHDLSTFVYDVLLKNLSEEALAVFVLRWCEGLSFLLKEHAIGVLTTCGESVTKHLQFVIEVLTIVVLTTQTYAEMALCSVKVLQVDNAATLYFALLSLLFGSRDVLGCARELTELLLVFVHRTPEEKQLYALRSSCTQEARLTFSAKMRTVLQDRAGSHDNVYRLRLLRALQTKATSVFDYLVGPCSLPKGNDVQELSDLPLCRTLCTIIKQESADGVERALALLIQQDISTSALPSTRLLTLLSELKGQDALKDAAFVAATISFIDLIATQHLNKESASPDGSITHLSPPQRVHPGSSTKPQKNLTISTTTNVQGTYQLVEKTWDHALKALNSCKEAYLKEYEALSQDLRSYQAQAGRLAVQETLNRAAATNTNTTTSLNFTAFPTSVAEVENQTRHLSRLLWEHATSKQLKESKLANFYDYFSRSTNPFKTEALENVNTVNACISSLPYPLVAGPHLLFRNEKDERLCVTLNMLTSYMEVLVHVAASVRFAVVLRGTDYDSTAEDATLSRNVDVLQVALEVLRVTAYQSHPLLIFSRQRCFTAFLSLASTLAQYIPPKSIEKDAFRPLIDFLVDFAQLNVSHLEVLNPTLSIFLCFHDDLARTSGRVPAVFDLLNTVLHRHQINVKAQDKEWDTFLTNVNHFFDQYGVLCTAPVYSTLPLLIRRAVELTDFIGINEGSSLRTEQFEAILTTVISIVRSDAEGKYYHYVPKEPVAALLHTLGSMRHSALYGTSSGEAGTTASTSATYREKAWHILWNATLRFVLILLTIEREFVTDHDILVRDDHATSWLSCLTGVLSASPRFLNALSGLAGPEKDSRYCVWDFREILLCTQIAVVVSSLANPTTVFRVPVQACFLQFLHYRPARLGTCVSSSAATETAQAEERLMEEYMVLTVREQLSFFLLQAPLTATSEVVHPFLAFILQDKQLETTASGSVGRLSRWDYGTFFVSTLAMLCSFIRQEHSYLRRASAAGMMPTCPAQPGAPFSEVPSRASFSRASSVTCTPRHTGLSAPHRPTELTAADLNESVATESTCESFTPNATAQESHIRLQSVHVENTQLALNLYCVAVEELLSNTFSQSPVTSQKFYSEFIHCTKNLVHMLKSMLADISGTDTPFFLTDYVTRVYVKLKKVVLSA